MKTKLFLLLLALCFSQPWAIASETRSKYEKYLLVADRDKYTQAVDLITVLIGESPKDDLYLSERARMNMNLSRWNLVMADCNKALAINPNNISARRTRSYCHFMLKEYDKGIADLKEVIKNTQPDPINMWPRNDHENLGRAYAMTGQQELARKERPLSMLDQLTEQALIARDGAGVERALKLLAQVLQKDPKHLNALGVKGLCHNNLTQFKEAIDCFNKALAQKPNCPPLLYLRADCYRETKQYEKAIADLTKILQIKPRLVLFKYAAHTGRLRDKFSHADTDCVNMADIYYLRGTCYDATGKYDLAIKDFDKTVELDAKEYKAATGAANAYFNMRKFNDAVKAYTKALSINPRYWEAYTLRSRAYEQIGDTTKAAADLSSVLSQHPEDVGAYMLRAQIYQRAKQYQKAIDDFTKMTELAPSDDDAYRERADCYANLGKYDLAIKDYDKALSLSSEDKEVIGKAKAAVQAKMKKSAAK